MYMLAMLSSIRSWMLQGLLDPRRAYCCCVVVRMCVVTRFVRALQVLHAYTQTQKYRHKCCAEPYLGTSDKRHNHYAPCRPQQRLQP
jgi:hypothetical protein